MTRRLALAWFALSLAGAVFAGLALANHYGQESGFCTLGAKLNCDIVNRGPYAELAGLPVAGIGLAGYLGLLALGWRFARRPDAPLKRWLVALTLAGLAFSLYLTGLEIWTIGVFCPLCLGSQLSILGLAALTFRLRPSPAAHP